MQIWLFTGLAGLADARYSSVLEAECRVVVCRRVYMCIDVLYVCI
jgi:hypothetical protein